MLYQKRVDRAMKWSRERRMRADGRDPEKEALDREVRSHGKGQWKEEELPPMEEIVAEEQDMELEKGDLPAMIGAALITILPVCILVLVLLCLAGWLMFK